ncbi:MAG: molybdenum cofactor guanylyltransferase [Abditibacteriota bacterium]|nr:molybdenum cofactor guanylyltransferase [Abditibacteriota bacterium]
MLSIAILAGGQSRRMGTDKATLRVGQSTLLERTAHMARVVVSNVLIVGRERPLGWPQSLSDVCFIADEHPHSGPLGGLQSALKALAPEDGSNDRTKVLLLACDLPRVNESALQWLCQAAASSAATHGTIVNNAGQLEPLFSVYNWAVEPLVEQQMQSGRRSMHGLIAGGDFTVVGAPAWLAPLLANLNTPEEWHSLLRDAEK